MAGFPLHRYVLAVALAGLVRPATAVGLLAATFQDHAVLQRESLIPAIELPLSPTKLDLTRERPEAQ